MRDFGRDRKPTRGTKASKIDAAIFIVGLVAASGSSVAAYRLIGPYGDGPINVRLYRSQDPETGEQFVYREVVNDSGTILRYLFDDVTRKLMQVQVLRLVDGKPQSVDLHMGDHGLSRVDVAGHSVERTKDNLVKIGFSLRGNGVIDAWEYRDPNGQLVKIDVARHPGLPVDRWEYYENDQLARVEEDQNRDGRVDHWLNYEAGILVKESWDRDGDGRPDR